MLGVAEVIVVVVIIINDVQIVAVEPHRRPGLSIREPIAAILEAVGIMAPVSVEIMVVPEVVVIVAVGNHAPAMTRMDVAGVIIFTRRETTPVIPAMLFLSRVVLPLNLLPGIVLLLFLPRLFLLPALLLLLPGPRLLLLGHFLLPALLFLLSSALLILLFLGSGLLLLLSLPLLLFRRLLLLALLFPLVRAFLVLSLGMTWPLLLLRPFLLLRLLLLLRVIILLLSLFVLLLA